MTQTMPETLPQNWQRLNRMKYFKVGNVVFPVIGDFELRWDRENLYVITSYYDRRVLVYMIDFNDFEDIPKSIFKTELLEYLLDMMIDFGSTRQIPESSIDNPNRYRDLCDRANIHAKKLIERYQNDLIAPPFPE